AAPRSYGVVELCRNHGVGSARLLLHQRPLHWRQPAARRAADGSYRRAGSGSGISDCKARELASQGPAGPGGLFLEQAAILACSSQQTVTSSRTKRKRRPWRPAFLPVLPPNATSFVDRQQLPVLLVGRRGRSEAPSAQAQNLALVGFEHLKAQAVVVDILPRRGDVPGDTVEQPGDGRRPLVRRRAEFRAEQGS